VEVGRAIGGEEITEVERERRVRHSIAVGVPSRKVSITQALIFGRLEQEEIDPVGRRISIQDAIGRFRRNLDRAIQDAVEPVLGDAVSAETFARLR